MWSIWVLEKTKLSHMKRSQTPNISSICPLQEIKFSVIFPLLKSNTFILSPSQDFVYDSKMWNISPTLVHVYVVENMKVFLQHHAGRRSYPLFMFESQNKGVMTKCNGCSLVRG